MAISTFVSLQYGVFTDRGPEWDSHSETAQRTILLNPIWPVLLGFFTIHCLGKATAILLLNNFTIKVWKWNEILRIRLEQYARHDFHVSVVKVYHMAVKAYHDMVMKYYHTVIKAYHMVIKAYHVVIKTYHVVIKACHEVKNATVAIRNFISGIPSTSFDSKQGRSPLVIFVT